MGKASKRKKAELPDHGQRVAAGLCLHCGKRAAREGFNYCGPCTSQAQGYRRSRLDARPVPTSLRGFKLAPPTDPIAPTDPAYWQTVIDHLNPDQPDQESQPCTDP